MIEWLVNNDLKICGRMRSWPDFDNTGLFFWEDFNGHANKKGYFVCTNLRPPAHKAMLLGVLLLQQGLANRYQRNNSIFCALCKYLLFHSFEY
jgi:hypothetical protein